VHSRAAAVGARDPGQLHGPGPGADHDHDHDHDHDEAPARGLGVLDDRRGRGTRAEP
jgi:hypothetical protein